MLLDPIALHPTHQHIESTDSDVIDAEHDWTPLDASSLHLLSILQCLHAEHGSGRMQVALAVLCKRLGLRMSTLQRLMTALETQALVEVHLEKERLVASLTTEGMVIAEALQSV